MDMWIENARPELNYSMVPRSLIEDHTLSAEARLALIFMCSRPPGYLMRVAEVQAVLGIGEHKWRRVAKELRTRGGIEIVNRQCRTTGRQIGRGLRVTWLPWLNPEEEPAPKPSQRKRKRIAEPSETNESETDGAHRRKPRRAASATVAPNKRERSQKERAARASYEKWRAWADRTGGGTYGDWLDTEEGKAALKAEQEGTTDDART